MKDEVADLRRENGALWNKVGCLEKKADDLEGRSKRNNLLFYGIDREEDETTESCEDRLRDIFTDKLELSGDIEFDRVHRISPKPNSPLIARCMFYKDKVKILKAEGK